MFDASPFLWQPTPAEVQIIERKGQAHFQSTRMSGRCQRWRNAFPIWIALQLCSRPLSFFRRWTSKFTAPSASPQRCFFSLGNGSCISFSRTIQEKRKWLSFLVAGTWRVMATMNSSLDFLLIMFSRNCEPTTDIPSAWSLTLSQNAASEHYTSFWYSKQHHSTRGFEFFQWLLLFSLTVQVE